MCPFRKPALFPMWECCTADHYRLDLLCVDRCLFRVKWLKLYTGANMYLTFLISCPHCCIQVVSFLSVLALFFSTNQHLVHSSAHLFDFRNPHCILRYRYYTAC